MRGRSRNVDNSMSLAHRARAARRDGPTDLDSADGSCVMQGRWRRHFVLRQSLL